MLDEVLCLVLISKLHKMERVTAEEVIISTLAIVVGSIMSCYRRIEL